MLRLLTLVPAQAERRHVSLSALDHRVTRLFYVFDIVNSFFGTVLGGTVFSQIGAALKTPGD